MDEPATTFREHRMLYGKKQGPPLLTMCTKGTATRVPFAPDKAKAPVCSVPARRFAHRLAGTTNEARSLTLLNDDHVRPSETCLDRENNRIGS